MRRGEVMSNNSRNLLELLRFELSFLEDGGYGRSLRAPWRASYIFEDSPTCLYFSEPSRPHKCDQCMLMQLVPAGFREEEVPCRYIPINSKGETVESLYRTCAQGEIEEAVGDWLRRQIKRLE